MNPDASFIDGQSIRFSDFEHHYPPAESPDSFEARLSTVFTYAHQAVTSLKWRGHGLYVPQLDKALLELSATLDTAAGNAADRDCGDEYVLIATEIYGTGGHGRLLQQFASQRPTHIIFSDIFQRLIKGQIRVEEHVGESCLSCTAVIGNSLSTKLRSMNSLIRSIRPRAIIALGHHQDVLALTAALCYHAGRRTVFIHHCDHEPALGASIGFPCHVDMTSELSAVCRTTGHDPLVWPLASRDGRTICVDANAQRRIATCGTENKFKGTLNGVGYPDLVARILGGHPENELHHVGPISQSFLSHVRERLTLADIDSSRFKAVGAVKNLAEFLVTEKIGVMLQSFPFGGGLTAVEAQSAGVPMIYANPDRWSAPLSAIRSIYADSDLEWDSIDQVPSLIDRIFNHHRRYSANARTKYLENFQWARLPELIERIDDRFK